MKKKEKNIDTKIDELARVVASGFIDVHKEIRVLGKEIKGVRSELGEEIRVVDKKVSVLSKEVSGLGKEVSGLGKEIKGIRVELGKEIDGLAQMTAQGFTEMHKEMHDGIADLRDELKRDMKFLRGDVDIMLDKHIGAFRKDYDDLAVRVKDLEQV